MQQKQLSLPVVVSALGVVYGDIGTSPLYALKSCFTAGELAVNPENIIGLVSLICWVLFLVVTIKYVHLVMRVDEQGEGGILVLSHIAAKLKLGKYKKYPFILGVLGAALFFGDGVITPAISILGALEGLEVASPMFKDYILWMACLILALLFLIQKSGSHKIGQFFGPIMVVWFITLASMGIYNIIKAPYILAALNPFFALKFFYTHEITSFAVLGGIILVVTGAEALYADMGHFGKKPIKVSWTYFVLPALLLNYLGQGALLLMQPLAIKNPFYLLVPEGLSYPLVILSTLATVIASQALISGVFSVGWQGIMLGYLPRLKVIHTSFTQRGEVYVPALNIVLGILTIGAVLKFQSTENLAVAYGLSVAGVMLLTNILVFTIAYYQWKWRAWKLFLVFVPLVILDVIFVVTNLIKILDGAWYALTLAGMIIYVIRAWQQGNKALNRQKFHPRGTLSQFLTGWEMMYPQKIPGTAVFMTRLPDRVPNSLVIHLNHNKLLHEKMIFVSIQTSFKPHERGKDKYAIRMLGGNNFAVIAKYGFKEMPDLHKVIHFIQSHGIIKHGEELSFFLSKGIAVPDKRGVLSGLAEKIYIYLTKNSLAAYEFYKIPHEHVVELGVRYKV